MEKLILVDKCVLQKNSIKEFISVASLLPLLPKDLSWMVSENWSLVCEKLGKGQELFSVPTSGNPSMSMYALFIVI